MRVGLFGGSFNPPHAGHIHASEIALKYLDLDAVWWLVSTGNPLKNKTGLPDTDTRKKLCRQLAHNPRIVITDIEKEMGTTRTFDTVTALSRYFPSTDFIWIAGMDIAHEFQKWYKWQSLIETIPFAFVGRPTHHGSVRQNVFRQSAHLRQNHLFHGGHPSLEKSQIYWIQAEPLLDISSTNLRNIGKTGTI